MTDIMAKDRVKKLIVQRMMDAGWKMQPNASMEFLVEEYITELRQFSEDELNAAWNHVRNHSDDAEKTWRYWPPAITFRRAALSHRSAQFNPAKTADTKSFIEADKRARTYASNRVWEMGWPFRTRHLNEIRWFLTEKAIEQVLSGREPDVIIPEHVLQAWKETCQDPAVIDRTAFGFKTVAEAAE